MQHYNNSKGYQRSTEVMNQMFIYDCFIAEVLIFFFFLRYGSRIGEARNVVCANWGVEVFGRHDEIVVPIVTTFALRMLTFLHMVNFIELHFLFFQLFAYNFLLLFFFLQSLSFTCKKSFAEKNKQKKKTDKQKPKKKLKRKKWIYTGQ